MYLLEIYQNPSYKNLVAFESLKEGKESVSKIQNLCTFQAEFKARLSSPFHGA